MSKEETNTEDKNKNEKDKNKSLIDSIMEQLIQREDLPIGQLIVFFHAANSLCVEWGKSDTEEKRNYEYLKRISPSFSKKYIQAFVSGSFKPAGFIHPFELYHTTEGSQDIYILEEFFQTTDKIAGNLNNNKNKICEEYYDFLAYVYMYFLVIHPFVDGNGRVARNLLSYFNKKLGIGLHPCWDDENPKFSDQKFHKDAFNKLFSEELGLTPICINKSSYAAVANINKARAYELSCMEENIIFSLRKIKENGIQSESIKMMSKGIQDINWYYHHYRSSK